MYINEALEIYHRIDKRFPGQHMSSEARTLALYGMLLKLSDDRQEESCLLLDKAVTLYTKLDS